MSDQVFWFATRSAGIMCWMAAAASMVVGLLITTRALGRRPSVPWLTDLHRYLAAMAMVFLGLHLVTLWLDPFVGFGLADLVIPFSAEVPSLTGWGLAVGVVAAWIMVAVQVSSLVKSHLPPDVWHTIHLGSYGSMVAGAVHAVETGSDTDNRLLISVAASMVSATVLLTAIRVSRQLTERKRRYDDDIDHEPAVDGELTFDQELALEPEAEPWEAGVGYTGYDTSYGYQDPSDRFYR